MKDCDTLVHIMHVVMWQVLKVLSDSGASCGEWWTSVDRVLPITNGSSPATNT